MESVKVEQEKPVETFESKDFYPSKNEPTAKEIENIILGEK